MILYFSGTGNSRYIAELLAKELDDELQSMNQLIKKGEPVKLSSDRPWVIVCPTYAWRPPRIVTEFIGKNRFVGNRKVYFLLTCDTNTLNSIHYVRETCQKKGWELMGFAEIIMTDNYIIMAKNLRPEAEIQKRLAHAEREVRTLATLMANSERLPSFCKSGGIVGKISGSLVNDFFYRVLIDGKGFYATEDCINCGKCTAICPLNNIKAEAGRPTWGGNCTNCMACIGICPVQAVEYKNKTKGKKRYYLKKRASKL